MTKGPNDNSNPFGTALSKSRPDLKTHNLGDDPAAVGKRRFRDAFYLAVERIRVDKEQVRKEGKEASDPDTQALAASIQEQGLQQLIVVRYLPGEDVYQVVSGERRFVAMTELLHWDEIPVRLLDVPEMEVMWFQLHENLLRKSLSPRDLATAIQQAKSEGLSLKQIAAKLHRSETWVQKALTIAEKLTDEALQELQQGPQGESLEVMYSVATAPEAAQQAIAGEVVEQNLSKRDVQTLVAKRKKGGADEAVRGRPAKSRPFQEEFRVSGGLSITISARRSNVSTGEVEEGFVEALSQLRKRADDFK